MKSNFSKENIKYTFKKFKSSTDIKKILNENSLKDENINNEDKNIDSKKDNIFYCNHNLNFISFCEICTQDLCFECEKNHINHKIIKYSDIIPNKEEINLINDTIKKYSEVYNKLIEELFIWKKDLDKKIFYFEELIKNDYITNKNIEYIKKFDFSKINNYSSIIKYKKICELISKPEIKNDSNNNSNNNINTKVGCYKYQNYINLKKMLEKILEYKNDFIVQSNEIIKLIISFLSSNGFKNNLIKEEDSLSPINKENYENNNFFNSENLYNNNTYTFSNTGTKESNINEININYFTNEQINTTDNDSNNNTNLDKIKTLVIQKNENQSIGNIFLDSPNELINNEKNKSNINTNDLNFEKSSTLRKLNVFNSNKISEFRNKNKDIIFNKKKKNESNSVNYVNTKLNQNLYNNKNDDEMLNTNINNIGMIINKYVPKVKKQNRVYNINSINHKLNTINNYSNVSLDKKKIYKHKKLNSISISNYINSTSPIECNTNFNKNLDYDNKNQIINNTTLNCKYLLKPMNLGPINSSYNITLDNKKDSNLFNTNKNQIYPIKKVDTNVKSSLHYSLQDSNSLSNFNKRVEMKKKLLTENNLNSIKEAPIAFNSKLNSENKNKKKNNKLINNINEFSIIQKNLILNDASNNYNDNNIYQLDTDKNFYVGLELGNSECRLGIAKQNNYNNIELFEFYPDNKESKNTLPTILSFDEKSNDIKIGIEAQNNILNEPSQTIFNILKIIGKSYKQINNDIDLWPFKLYYNEDLCRPYVKINYNKQKNRIFFFEDLLSIFLKKLFEIFFSKIKLIKNNLINLILVVTVPNNYNYLQRKIIEKIFQTQIFPQSQEINIADNIEFENKKYIQLNVDKSNINKVNKNKEDCVLYSGYKITLKDIKIENASSVAPLCLFNNKIKFKNDIENIINNNNEKKKNDNNIKKNIIMTYNNEENISNLSNLETNKEFNLTSPINTTNKNLEEKESNNDNNKNILVINIDGGFTNISLACSSLNKQKEKNNNKLKNVKSSKKNKINILEIKEISGIEYGEEDFTDIYINDCLKQFEDNIYKDCLKSKYILAHLRHTFLVEKKNFISSKKDNSIKINLSDKFLDLEVTLNQKDYEKSCQEIFSKIILNIKNLLRKSKLSEKIIDIIILTASNLTTNNLISSLKNIFSNSKIIYNNCNNYIAIGATMQALNNNILKPLYKFIDITNMNFGIETLNGIMDIIIPKGLIIPVQKIKYVKIKYNDNNSGESAKRLNKYLEINIFEGDNKFVKNNRLISCANIDKRNFKEEKIGNGFIELLVEFEISSYSNLNVYVLDSKDFKRRFECLTNLDMIKG